MATREYAFVVGPETSTLPTAGTPSASTDLVTKGYADENYTQGGSAVADITALKAVSASNRKDKDLRYVESTGIIYAFDSGSAATGDDDFVVTPSAGSGRWLKVRENPVKLIANQNITAAGTIAIDGRKAVQVLKITGSGGAVTTANAAFTVTGTLEPIIIVLVGQSDTNTVTIPFANVANGCLLNGDWVGGANKVLALYADTGASRYVELFRSY